MRVEQMFHPSFGYVYDGIRRSKGGTEMSLRTGFRASSSI